MIIFTKKPLLYFIFFCAVSLNSLYAQQDTIRRFSTDSVVYLRTKTPLAYLNYGIGEDRLGGAKMGYIDSLILLKAISTYKDLYQVRLTPTLSAWIPKNLTQIDTVFKPKLPFLTTSWRVWGDDKYDYISIPLTERLPYRSWQEIKPSRIVIELFGVMANTNWLTQMTSAKEIQHIDYEQISDEQLRITIHLRHAQHWGYGIKYEGKRLIISVKQQPYKLQLSNLTVAIDAGHGGSNVGARGIRSKQWEKDLNLSIAKHLQREMERKGATVLMSRTKDTLINNTDRILKFRQLRPDLLISIHLNATADTTKVRGTSTYYKHIGFRPLSQAVLTELLRMGLQEYGNVGRFNFALNSPTEYPNVLVEGLFLSHPDDEALILEDAYRRRMARQIRKGVQRWLKEVCR